MVEKTYSMRYNHSLYIEKHLSFWAREYLKLMPKNVKIILSQGSSGVALASAMIILAEDQNLRNIYVPKSKNEKRHSDNDGNMVNSSLGVGYNLNLLKSEKNRSYKNCVIVDDFTNTGKTILKVIKFAESLELNIKAILIESLGVRSIDRLKNYKIIAVNQYINKVKRKTK
jgi:adenine/guanine phosphoribosyltransferase-like PRPP-binding protein